MPRSSTPAPPINTVMQKGSKETQRGRLITGMIAAANDGGYAHANVSEVIERAQVSRPTFYDYFTDKDDCFLAAHADIQQQLAERVGAALTEAAPAQALAVTVNELIGFAAEHPAPARFLMKESLAGGPKILDARDSAIDELAQQVHRKLKRAPETPVPDVPIAIAIGAVQRMLASRLRRGERLLEPLAEELRTWLSRYERPKSEQHWQNVKPGSEPDRSPYLPPVAPKVPAPLGRGRPGLQRERIAENHRQRIMFATAQVVQQHGYAAATVAEISAHAKVDPRVFYRLFTDKQDAFTAVHELGFGDLMALTAGAFFAGEKWPERIWEALRAATQSLQENPTATHVAFVEAYAVGPTAIQRVEDSRAAFTIFLHEGQQSTATQPGPDQLEAIMTAIFEVIYRQARASRKPRLARYLENMLALALTPFIGVNETERFIAEKAASSRARANGRTQKPRRNTRSSR